MYLKPASECLCGTCPGSQGPSQPGLIGGGWRCECLCHRVAEFVPPAWTNTYPLFKHLADEHGLTLLESQLDEIIRLAKQEGTVSEPTTPGFYWWRQTPNHEWKMVRVKDFSDGLGSQPDLVAYDYEDFIWGGKTIRVWKERGTLGEWLAVERPTK